MHPHFLKRKSAARVHKIFDICKDLHKKTHPKMRFFGIQRSAFSRQLLSPLVTVDVVHTHGASSAAC